jgi:hypothetical protein
VSVKPYLEYFKARVQERIYRKRVEALGNVPEEIVQSLQVKGFYVWENFLDDETCDRIRNSIDNLTEKYSESIWRDEEDADNRIYNAELLDKDIRDFNQHEALKNLAGRYLHTRTTPFVTLANRIKAKSGENRGSGGGWHRDTNYIHQFKSIVYLNDVNSENGPFQYVSGTQFKGTLFEFRKFGIKLDQNRLNDEEVERIVDGSDYSITEFTAKRGTCLLVDTSGIHRGKPLMKGERYALTNYFYQDYFINKGLKKKFEKISAVKG